MLSSHTEGAGGRSGQPVGGDLGESIPKGIDVGPWGTPEARKPAATQIASLTAAAGFPSVSSVAASHRG